MNDIKYEPVIGLEIHVELKTNSKMFCGCDANWFGKEPNTHCCPVCLGMPGALPVPNKKAVEWCVMMGLALNCEIPLFSKFDRKNYFYPDLPKGYQISQYDKPFAINGSIKIKSPIVILGSPDASVGMTPESQRDPGQARMTEEKVIRIRRVHMEEDTGKLIHAKVEGENATLIDFNRSGVPLVEIVTEPDIRSSEEARIFLKKLHQIIRFLGISDADMEKGSMRLEPNISVRKLSLRADGKQSQSNNKGIASSLTAPRNDIDFELPPYKVEVKNINSFNFVKKAIDYEIKKHIEILERGKLPVQETRGWDEKRSITYSQRSKEEAHDYRYFPEPDIPPVLWTEVQISKFKDQIPELPDQKTARFMKDYNLSEYDSTILTDDLKTANYFESAVQQYNDKAIKQFTLKVIANWIINKKADITKNSPEELLKLIAQKSQKSTMTDAELEKVCQATIEANPKAVSDYKAGKQQSLMFLLGQVMRETKDQADAAVVKTLLIKLLSN